ncbi:MAG: phosphotransferase [Acutalibacteraceae bacterium]|nr:phosphotransferase [Acutalibacteraceae bacterium]
MIYDKILAERKGKAVYKVGNTIVKLFDSEFPKSDILNEALNHARVEETGITMPSLIAVSMIDNKWSMTIDFIEGKTLQQLMDENPDKIDEYINLFVDLQMEIHSKKAPLLNKLKDKMVRKISNLQEVDATTRYELHTRLKVMPKHIKVCHGDFNPSNIIIDPSGKAYILDWSHATQGNASADVARTYLLFSFKQPEIADKYLKLFCLKSNTAKQYVLQWLPLVAASQMDKGTPEEKEFLLKWVNTVECE